MSTPRDYSLTFGAAGSQELLVAGKFLRVMSCTVNGASVFVSLGGGTELERFVGQGVNVAGSGGFSKFTIRVAVACTVVVNVADERQDDDYQSVSVTVSATVTPGNTITTTADVSILAASVGSVVAARADRLAVIIKNLTGNTSSFRVGESGSVGAGQGHELDPGDSIVLATTSEVSAYNADAGAQSLSVVEIRSV